MNTRELQAAVMEDLEALFSDRKYKTPNRTMASPKTYAQILPIRDAQAIDDPFPYIIVRLDSGGVETATAPHVVKVLFIVGIFDDATGDFRDPPPQWTPAEPGQDEGEDLEDYPDPEHGWDTRNFGPMAVMEIMEMIQDHYERFPSLNGGAFYHDGSFHWVFQEEIAFPYFIGACELAFTLAAPRKERSKFV